MATEVTMPKLGLTMTEGTIVEWRKQEGEKVDKGEILFVIETEKVTFEVEAPESGTLGKIVAKPADVIPVGGVVAYLGAPGEQIGEAPAKAAAAPAPAAVAPAPAAKAPASGGEHVKISPVAKKIAQENNIDISTLQGTGPGGRIVREDVEKAIAEGKTGAAAPATSAAPAAPAPEGPAEEVKPLSGMRKIIATRMIESFQTPHFYQTIEIEAGELMKARQALVPLIEKKAGVKVTVTDLLIKIAAKAIEDNPDINVSYLDGSVRIFRDVNIGMVAAVEGGLVVPVFHQANRKTLAEIAVKRAELVEKARARRLSKEEMTGSTFTISNLGMYGIDQFSAILQPPEAAIIAVSRTAERPVVRDGQIVIRSMMNITISIDHRVLDGVIAANFLNSLKSYIENPSLLLA